MRNQAGDQADDHFDSRLVFPQSFQKFEHQRLRQVGFRDFLFVFGWQGILSSLSISRSNSKISILQVNDDPVKIRDVINVSQITLKKDTPVLQLGAQYWAVRDSIVQTELIIIRALRFDVNVSPNTLPHSVSCLRILPSLTHTLKILSFFSTSYTTSHPYPIFSETRHLTSTQSQELRSLCCKIFSITPAY
jgi:hypothetical protein